MGECTEVASAKRAVLGVLRESEDDELEDVRGLMSTLVSFLSSVAVSLDRCCSVFDIAVQCNATRRGRKDLKTFKVRCPRLRRQLRKNPAPEEVQIEVADGCITSSET